MKRPSKLNIIFSAVSGILVLALAAFVTLFLIEHKKLSSCTEKYYAVIDDSIFDEYFRTTDQSILPADFALISASDFSALDLNNGKSQKGPYACAVAFVTKDESMAFFDSKSENALTKSYALKSKYYFPSAPTDFNQLSSINMPNFTLSLSDAESLPEGNMALTVDSKYAGDEGYALEKKTSARCSVLVPSFSKSVLDFFDGFFQGKEPSSDNVGFVAAVGDIMVARGVQEILMYEDDGLEKVFRDTLPILQSNDITIGNLEGVVTESNKETTKTYVFKFHKEVLPELKKAGFNYLMQANNHCYDYGEQGFRDTLAALAEYDIPTSGAGYNSDEAKKFYHKTVNGINFAIISCGAFPVERSGFNGEKMATATDERAGILWQNEELFEDIKKEKAAGNFVIVNVHGGVEYAPTPNKTQRALYERFIDSGADVVFGSHPHVIQPTEWYKGKLIVYSLGNFIFNEMENMAGYGALETEIVRLGLVDGKTVYTEIYPAKIDRKSVGLK